MRSFFSTAGKWWPGLLPLIVLWLAAAWNTTAPVEAELTARTQQAISETILDKIRITPSGRDITLSAEAFSNEGRLDAVAQADAVPGVRVVNDETRLLPEAKPFIWIAERDVVRVTLYGNAPLPAVRTRLMETARAAVPNTEIVDQTTLARGAPTRFEPAAQLLLDVVGRLKDGKVMLSDTTVSLSGMARELGGREAISAALRNLPEGYSVADNAVKAPPYVFQANKDPVATTVTFSGYVPDNAVHASLIATAGRKFFDARVVDQLRSSLGAPVGFAQATAVALGALSRLSTGSLVIADREVKLSGDALYGNAADQIRASLATDLPQGWKAVADITVRPAASLVDPTVCQQLFTDLFRRGKIRFETAKATIDPDSLGLLDRLVEAALRCPGALIEVAGHTDGAGDAVANQGLSERRAQAVVDYLVKAGLPRDRLVAVGYGSSQPLASNETDDGKAQNRRIEFTIKEQQ